MKNTFIRASKKLKQKLKDIGLQGEGRIYCEDHLTAKNKPIPFRAKQMSRNGELMFVWIRDGCVFVWETADCQAFKITNTEQLEPQRQQLAIQSPNDKNKDGNISFLQLPKNKKANKESVERQFGSCKWK